MAIEPALGKRTSSGERKKLLNLSDGLNVPMQLGPIIRTPNLLAVSFSLLCRSSPSVPVSEKPPLTTIRL